MMVSGCVNQQNNYTGVDEAVGEVPGSRRCCAALRLREFGRSAALCGAGRRPRSRRRARNACAIARLAAGPRLAQARGTRSHRPSIAMPCELRDALRTLPGRGAAGAQVGCSVCSSLRPPASPCRSAHHAIGGWICARSRAARRAGSAASWPNSCGSRTAAGWNGSRPAIPRNVGGCSTTAPSLATVDGAHRIGAATVRRREPTADATAAAPHNETPTCRITRAGARQRRDSGRVRQSRFERPHRLADRIPGDRRIAAWCAGRPRRW